MLRNIVLIFIFMFLLNSNKNLLANNVCEKIILETEVKLNIPKYLLLSIALTESGRKINGKLIPWPWSINTKGKGLYFKNKDDLVSYASNNLKKNINNFDMGCMQVNYYYHGKKFKNLNEMADPLINVSWAGKFLIGLHQKHLDWKEAISRYHSNTTWRKQKYFKKVMNNWAYVRNNSLFEVAKLDDRVREDIANKKNKNQKKITSNTTKTDLKNNKNIKLMRHQNKQISKYRNEQKLFYSKEEKLNIINNNESTNNNSISTIEDLEEIRLTEVGKNELENDLIKLMPKQVSKILFINEFKYMDKTTIEDNLKRIEEYKKDR